MFTQTIVGCRSEELLELGILLAHGHSQLGPRFQDSDSGYLKARVLCESSADEIIEDRIAKGLPPLPVIGAARSKAWIRGVLPLIQQLCVER